VLNLGSALVPTSVRISFDQFIADNIHKQLVNFFSLRHFSESSKAYWIYIPGQIKIEVRRDVIFEEEIAFCRSIESHMEIDNEKKEETIPSPPSIVQREKVIDPVDPVDPVSLVDVPPLSGEIDPHIYRQLIGSLMYLVNTRPDICYAMSVLSQFMCQLRQTHWIKMKRVLIYVQGTVGYGLEYASPIDMILEGYVDVDWARSAVDQKSTFGCCFTLGFSMVSWCSKKQNFVALSTVKQEYIALCVVVREAVWLHKVLTDLFGHDMDSIVIHCDNQSCVKFSENPVFHDKSKHTNIKYHYIRDMVQRKVVHV
jgi:hypothetical protein